MPPLPSSRLSRYGPIWEPTRDSRSSLIGCSSSAIAARTNPSAELRLARRDLERELVIADADPVVVGQRRRAANAFATDIHTVCRAKIGDDETCAGVDDDGVVAADVGVVEHDVVVGQPSDPGRRRPQ